MTRRSDAERSRAKRVRAAVRAGTASRADIAWLREYAPSDPLLRAREWKPALEPTPEPAPEPVPEPEPATPPGETWVPVDPEPEDEDEDGDDIESPEPEEPATDPVTAALAKRRRVCEIEDCPACAGRLKPGPQKCATTGEMVYPQISMNTARMLAGGVLWLIEAAISFLYKADNVTPATDLEVDALAEALIEVTRRRFGAIAMVDDLIAPFWPISSYFSRARRSALDSRKTLPRSTT